MGNVGSTGRRRRRNNGHSQHSRSSQPQPEPASNSYVFAAASPYPPLPAPYDHHHRRRGVAPPQPIHVAGEFPPVMMVHSHHDHGRYTYAPPLPTPTPYVEHQKAVTIRNDVNLKKETLRFEPDVGCSGRFLVAFTFDATVAGSMIVYFFAKEELNCSLTATKEDLLKPVTVKFKEGLGQKFMQPSGTGIDFSLLDEAELLKEGDMGVYPLTVKAETASSIDQPSDHKTQTPNSQITQAVLQKEEHENYTVRVIKQILWVNGTRYELQEIYGIGNSVEGDSEENDPGKECAICLSEPRDTTVLPCRHMCMCSKCAKVLMYKTNRCPICRQPVERLLEIKVNNKAEEHEQTPQSPPPPPVPPVQLQQGAEV